MVMEIGSPSEAWRALKKIEVEMEDGAHDRAKREFETLQMGDSETVSEYLARVNIIIMKLERYNITTSAREIKRIAIADGGPDHRRGARLTACPAGLCHGFHLQSRFGRRPHGQWLTRGTGRSCSNLIEASRRGPALQVQMVYTHCLYYYCPIQHMTVPRVIHTHTPTTITLNVGTVQV